jgi:1-acyl-sn-glycerol-3-phosphate acyltransferase
VTARALLRAGRQVGRGVFGALAELGAVRLAPPRDERAAAHRLAGALGALARAHALEVFVHGEVPRRAALVVVNHVSFLDPLAVLPSCPALPLVDVRVASWPIIGPMAAALGVLFVEPASATDRIRALRRLDAVLAGDTPVLHFAEGVRGDGTVGPLWRGAFGVAQRRGVPIVPVAIRYHAPALAWRGDEAMLTGYLRAAGHLRPAVSVGFGPPLHGRTGEAPERLASRTRSAIARQLERLARVAPAEAWRPAA